MRAAAKQLKQLCSSLKLRATSAQCLTANVLVPRQVFMFFAVPKKGFWARQSEASKCQAPKVGFAACEADSIF